MDGTSVNRTALPDAKVGVRRRLLAGLAVSVAAHVVFAVLMGAAPKPAGSSGAPTLAVTITVAGGNDVAAEPWAIPDPPTPERPEREAGPVETAKLQPPEPPEPPKPAPELPKPAPELPKPALPRKVETPPLPKEIATPARPGEVERIVLPEPVERQLAVKPPPPKPVLKKPPRKTVKRPAERQAVKPKPQPRTKPKPEPRTKPRTKPKPRKARKLAAKRAPATAPSKAKAVERAQAQTALRTAGEGGGRRGGAEIPFMTTVRFARRPTPAHYPPLSLEREEEGVVIVRALVRADGFAGRVTVWKSSGYPRLDEAARRAVGKWQFKPARRGGRAIRAWVQIPVAFRIR